MVFDIHSDVLTDVVQKREQGKKDVIKNYHYEKMVKAQVLGGIYVLWVAPPHSDDPFNRMMECIKFYAKEVLDDKDTFKIVKKYEDIDLAVKEKKLAIIAGVEGLSGIKGDVNFIDVLYMLGFRHASLTWNEQNELGTGARGDENRGLTEKGQLVIERMEQLGMILDVAHANEKTFWDIHKKATKPYIASHSNCRAVCNNRRNLDDNQLKAIAEKGGVVGLNSYAAFVHDDHKKLDAHHLSFHIDHMVKTIGIDHIAFGFDFGDFLTTETVSSFLEADTYGAKDIDDVTKVPNFIALLKQRGYTDSQLEKICYKNIFRVFREIL